MHSDFEEFAEEPKPEKVSKVRFIIGTVTAVIRILITSAFLFFMNWFQMVYKPNIQAKITYLSSSEGMTTCMIENWQMNSIEFIFASLLSVIHFTIIFGKDKPKYIIIFTIAEALLLMVIIILARRCFGGPCDLECFQERIKP